MFEGFDEFDVEVSATSIHGRIGGAGPPVLLLHGIPETHLMWHAVAPGLAEDFTVVATDLRGFGDSGVPESDDAHASYSMRSLAVDQVEVMRSLGHETFAVVGHDRGARCAYRMALDHPGEVERVAVLDIVPTGHVFDHADKDFSLGFWVWSFLAAPAPVPESLVVGDPGVFVDHMLQHWSEDASCFDDDVRASYVRQFADPDRVHAICEQYRAAATVDVEHDKDDLGRRRITAPLLALWSAVGPVEAWYRPLEVWREWANEVEGRPMRGGHFLPEENPGEVTDELRQFLSKRP